MRAAIYFLPQSASSLWIKASKFIGYDAATGETFMPMPFGVLSAGSVLLLTEEPRRYGFHATLKAPFHIAAGRTLDDLAYAASKFAAQWTKAPSLELSIRLLEGFAALALTRPCEAVNELAGECVAFLDDFRAPMSPEESSRRMSSSLTDAQVALMNRWGYPYVFEEFRFHMTLTSKLPNHFQQPVLSALRNYFTPEDLLLRLDAISVCIQPSPKDRFREYARFALGGDELTQQRLTVVRET